MIFGWVIDMRLWFGQCWHELKLVSFWRQDMVLPIGFFALTVLMFPLGLRPDPLLLKQSASGIIIVSLLFAHLLSLDRLLKPDHESGLLDVYRLHPMGVASFMFAKIVAHWLALTLPVIILSPLVAILFDLSSATLLAMVLAILCGSPYLSLVGALGAALTLRARQGALMLIVIILPLFVSPLIFMAGAIQSTIKPNDSALAASIAVDVSVYLPQLALLGGMSLIAAVICPLLVGLMIKVLD